MPSPALVPESRKQRSLQTWRRLQFAHARGGRFGYFRKHARFAYALRTTVATGRMLDHGLAQRHIEQFHPHKSMHDLVELPARHAIHALPPKRAPRALVPARLGRSFSSKIERARFNRDLTVPTGPDINVDD